VIFLWRVSGRFEAGWCRRLSRPSTVFRTNRGKDRGPSLSQLRAETFVAGGSGRDAVPRDTPRITLVFFSLPQGSRPSVPRLTTPLTNQMVLCGNPPPCPRLKKQFRFINNQPSILTGTVRTSSWFPSLDSGWHLGFWVPLVAGSRGQMAPARGGLAEERTNLKFFSNKIKITTFCRLQSWVSTAADAESIVAFLSERPLPGTASPWGRSEDLGPFGSSKRHFERDPFHSPYVKAT